MNTRLSRGVFGLAVAFAMIIVMVLAGHGMTAKAAGGTEDPSVSAYTVDFKYTEPQTGKVYTYSLEGGGSITLEELAVLLGITTGEDADAFISNVEEVHFSNESLVEVRKAPSCGWELYSLAPFHSEEQLTIMLKNGTEIRVLVTDVTESTELVNFLTNAVITGATQNADGEYVVEANRNYSFILSFAESSSFQFDNDATLTYQIPAGIKILEAQTGTFNVNIVYKGRTYQIGATSVLSTDGLLSITFDQSDPDFPRLTEATNVSFRYTYNAQFDGSNEKIHFSEDIERDIVFDDPDAGEAFAEKSATYDETTGTFHYTIKVNATGPVQDVVVKDTVIGDALIVDQQSIAISGNSSTPTGGMSSTGFQYTFPSMNKDEVITIQYDARVDFSKDTDGDGKITADQTKNTITVDPDPGDPHNSEYSREINYKYTIKKDGTEAGTTETGDKIINWEIEYNPLALVAVGGDRITDRISAASAEYMKYYGTGITVKVYDRTGALVDTRDIAYTALTSYSDSTWTYTIPAADTTPYRYVITYQTIVDMEKVAGGGVGVTLDNTANDDGGSVHVIPENGIEVEKEVASFSTEEVTWNTTLTIPQNGLTRAVVTDTYPARYFDGAFHTDVLKDGTLEITGLLEGEWYEVTYNPGSVVITFYQDANNTPGLRPSTGPRTVNVKLTTKVNQEWLEEGYEVPDLQPHVNTIELNGKSDTATVIFGKPGIVKTAELMDEKTFKYTITIAGLEEQPFHLTDTFDTSLLEVDTSKTGQSDHMYMYGGTQWSQIAGKTPVSYTDTETGIVFTVNTVPKQANGTYYPYYMISYYLKLKDGVDLEQLAIANGGEYDLINTAVWADHETQYTYKVVYDYLDKELLNEGELGDANRTAKYQITFNAAKATLNDGEPMEMKDVLSSNLSIDYSSVQITTDPAGIAVPYSISGGKGADGKPDGTTVATYTVPDATKVVITYDAFVRGTGTQKIVNKVSVNGRDEIEIVENEQAYTEDATGSIVSFKIVKVDGYDANKKLSGVKFKIFAEDPTLDFGEKSGHATEIFLTTDENGEIVFEGEDYDFYFNKVYHVQEVEASEDYAMISFDYLVTLTDQMSLVDYGEYIYYYSDTMQIKNWPLEGLVVEKQVESDLAADKERYYTFQVSILDENGDVNKDYNETNGDDTFVNGVVQFQLKDKETKMFWGFAKGTKYKVEEIDADGFTTTVTYSIFDEDGNVTEVKTDTGTSHTGELTQEDEVILFKNAKNEVGSLKIKKNVTVNGASTTTTKADGTYTFTITGPGDYTSTQTITVTNGTSDEKLVEGLVPGEYTVSEDTTKNPAGMSLTGGNDIEVTVTANNTADVPTAEFTNNYSASGEGEIKVRKNLVGRDWTNNDEFIFTISAPEGTPMPGLTSITITKSDADYTKSFGKITFTEEGEYTYTVTETKGESGGIIYDETEHTVTIKVKDNNEGELIADGCELIQTEEFTNTYKTTETKGELKVMKELKGREWIDNDTFAFTISAAEGTPMPEQTSITITKSDADHTKSFGEITFTKAGKYVYTVKETKSDIMGITYDTKEHKVTFEVVDDGEGHLVAKKGTQMIQTVKITNTYKPETGDNNHLALYLGMMIASLLALLILNLYRLIRKA